MGPTTNHGITLRNVRWHDLRHTCASSLVSGAWGRPWRLEEVAKVLGHSSIQTTQVYAHLATSVVQEAAYATPGPLAPLRDPIVIRTTLTPRRDKASRRTTEPKVVRSNRTGRAMLVGSWGPNPKNGPRLASRACGDPASLREAASG